MSEEDTLIVRSAAIVSGESSVTPHGSILIQVSSNTLEIYFNICLAILAQKLQIERSIFPPNVLACSLFLGR